MSRKPRVGDTVRIERDETLYPSKGTWPQFRGRTGTIVEINLGEYGVCFTNVRPRQDRPGLFDWEANSVAWFQDHEIARGASDAPQADRRSHLVSPHRAGPEPASNPRPATGTYPCPCGCGKTIHDYTQECFPTAPWDTPGLPPRRMGERCHHSHCAYRDDDPATCPNCHTSVIMDTPICPKCGRGD